MTKAHLLALCLFVSTASAYAETVVQIGSFRDARLAKQQSARAALIGIQTHVVEQKLTDADASQRVYYRVRTTAMPQKQAEQIAQRLRQENIEAIVLDKP